MFQLTQKVAAWLWTKTGKYCVLASPHWLPILNLPLRPLMARLQGPQPAADKNCWLLLCLDLRLEEIMPLLSEHLSCELDLSDVLGFTKSSSPFKLLFKTHFKTISSYAFYIWFLHPALYTLNYYLSFTVNFIGFCIVCGDRKDLFVTLVLRLLYKETKSLLLFQCPTNVTAKCIKVLTDISETTFTA